MTRNKSRKRKEIDKDTSSEVKESQHDPVSETYSNNDTIEQLKQFAVDPLAQVVSSSNTQRLLKYMDRLRRFVFPMEFSENTPNRKLEQLTKETPKFSTSLPTSDQPSTGKLRRGRSLKFAYPVDAVQKGPNDTTNDQNSNAVPINLPALGEPSVQKLRRGRSSKSIDPGDAVDQTPNDTTFDHNSGAVSNLKFLDSKDKHTEDPDPPRHSDSLLDFIGGHIERKVVPVCPRFQVEVPEWDASVDITILIGAYISDSQNSKWLGARVWPIEIRNDGTVANGIGDGRPNSCLCESPGSSVCVRHHIQEERKHLEHDLGPAFFSWKFNEIGEQVTKSWTAKAQRKFDSFLKKSSSSDTEDWLQRASSEDNAEATKKAAAGPRKRQISKGVFSLKKVKLVSDTQPQGRPATSNVGNLPLPLVPEGSSSRTMSFQEGFSAQKQLGMAQSPLAEICQTRPLPAPPSEVGPTTPAIGVLAVWLPEVGNPDEHAMTQDGNLEPTGVQCALDGVAPGENFPVIPIGDEDVEAELLKSVESMSVSEELAIIGRQLDVACLKAKLLLQDCTKKMDRQVDQLQSLLQQQEAEKERMLQKHEASLVSAVRNMQEATEKRLAVQLAVAKKAAEDAEAKVDLAHRHNENMLARVQKMDADKQKNEELIIKLKKENEQIVVDLAARLREEHEAAMTALRKEMAEKTDQAALRFFQSSIWRGPYSAVILKDLEVYWARLKGQIEKQLSMDPEDPRLAGIHPENDEDGEPACPPPVVQATPYDKEFRHLGPTLEGICEGWANSRFDEWVEANEEFEKLKAHPLEPSNLDEP